MKNSIKTLAMWLIILIIVVVLITSIVDNTNNRITYSELINKIDSGEIKEIELASDGQKAYVTLKNSSQEKEVNIPSLDSFMTYIHNDLVSNEIVLEEKSQSIFITILSLLSPFGILIIFLIFWFFIMNNQQGGNKTMSFGKSKARMMTQITKKIYRYGC